MITRRQIKEALLKGLQGPEVSIQPDPHNPGGLILQIDGLTEKEVTSLIQKLQDLDRAKTPHKSDPCVSIARRSQL